MLIFGAEKLILDFGNEIHIALELQSIAGHDTGFGRTRQTKKKGEYDVIFNYEDKKIGIDSAKLALRVVKDLIQNKDPKINQIVKKLKN